MKMDDDKKRKLNRLTRSVEGHLARSLLRWKYRREGRPMPMDRELGEQSREIADRAHEVIAERGKRVWKEIKKVYEKNSDTGGGADK